MCIRKFRGIIILLLLPVSLMAWERAMLHLTVPSSLDKMSLLFSVNHRFRGPVSEEPFETFFGVKNGANVSTQLRFAIIKGLEVKSHIFYSRSEYAFGVSYGMDVEVVKIKVQADAFWFTFKDFGMERENGFFLLFTAHSYPLFGRMAVTANIGYDQWSGNLGIGTGLDIGITKRLFLIAEYYPALERMEGLPENSFAAGIRVDTYGHQFIFQLSNGGSGGGPDIWSRRLMQGAADNDLYIGFTINRLFEF